MILDLVQLHLSDPCDSPKQMALHKMELGHSNISINLNILNSHYGGMSRFLYTHLLSRPRVQFDILILNVFVFNKITSMNILYSSKIINSFDFPDESYPIH